MEPEQFTVIDLVAADEQWAYAMVDETETEQCPECLIPSNMATCVSVDGTKAIMTGIFEEYALQYLTKDEALALKLTDEWAATEEGV